MPEHDFSEIAKLSERFSKDPKSRIFVQLADAYRKNGMIDEALDVLKQGLKFHPQYPLAHLIMGRCYFDKRQYIQAKESFETVIKFDPQNIVALRTLVQVTENLKDDAGQIAAYKGLLAVDPTDTGARDKLNVLEAAQKKQSFYTMTMAEEYERQGNLTEALKIYQQLSFTDPSDLVLQEKVSGLKQKLASGAMPEEPVKPKAETKVEGLEQFESYIKPHEINLGAQQKPPVEEKTVIRETAVDEKKPVPPPEKPAPPVTTAPELVSSVTDFILDQASPVEEKAVISEINIDEKKPVAPPKATLTDAQAPVESATVEPVPEPEVEITASPPETPAEPVPVSDILAEEPIPATLPPTAEEEVMSLTDLLTEAPPAQETAPAVEMPPAAAEPISEPVVPEPAPVPAPAVETEEVLSLDDVLASPSETETKPVEPPASEPEPVTPTVAETPAPPAASEVPPEAAPTPPAEEPKPTEDESAKKPKEEDFRSFQDWLSGLLK